MRASIFLLSLSVLRHVLQNCLKKKIEEEVTLTMTLLFN